MTARLSASRMVCRGANGTRRTGGPPSNARLLTLENSFDYRALGAGSVEKMVNQKKKGPRRGPLPRPKARDRLTQELQNRRLLLIGDRQRLDTQLLTGLERREVGAFFVEIRQHQLVRAVVEGVDVVLGEVQPGLQDADIGAQLRFEALQPPDGAGQAVGALVQVALERGL